MSELRERVRFLDPRLLEDTPRELVQLASRILRYERYLDHLELLKAKQGTLPGGVELSVGQSIQRALADVRQAGSLMLELIEHLELAGVLDLAVPNLAGRLPAPMRSAGSLVAEHGSYLETWVVERGMPLELWRWAVPYLDLNDLTAASEERNLRVLRGDTCIGVVMPTDESRLDAASMLGLRSRRAPARVGAATALRSAVHALLTFYEKRARLTVTNGVQVLPTGIAWIVIVIIVVALIAFVVGLVISVMCWNGMIKDKTTCEFGVALMVAGLLAGFVGAYTGGQQDETDPSNPDPIG
jgi:hypothetical protein